MRNVKYREGAGQPQLALCRDGMDGDRDGNGIGAEHRRVGHQPASGCCRGGAQADQSEPAAPWVWYKPPPHPEANQRAALRHPWRCFPKNLERCNQNTISVLKARNLKF